MISTTNIKPFFLNRDWDGLTKQLTHLSNMEFRKAEKLIRESILPSLPDDLYWESLQHLIKFKRAAFITGILALEQQLQQNENTLSTDCARAFATLLSNEMPDSVAKIINMSLPLLHTEKQIQELFATFHIDDITQRIAALLKVESQISYFVLFKTLKFMPDRQDIVRRCCIHIMKRNNDQAFNMASILRTYFGITDIKSQLSLQIDTYELSYLDRNYDTFIHILNGRRPQI